MKITNGTYVINLDDKQSKEIVHVLLFINRKRARYFDYFEIEYIYQDVFNKSKDKSNVLCI